MRYGSAGSPVKKIQEQLMKRGYKLPRYGADGHLGDETWSMLQQFAEDQIDLKWSPLVPDEVLSALGAPVQRPVSILPPPDSSLDVFLYDLREEQTNPPSKANKFKLVAGKVVHRAPSQVTGITIHQTAVHYSVADYQVAASDGDRELALARRSLDVACHVMAFHDGFIAWPNPLDWYVYHGNGFNASELGIEIDGNYPGLIGGKTWNGKTPTEVTDDVVKAACAGIELLVREGRKMGMPIEYIHAHRQSSATRRSDPGEELWKRVVLDYAVPVLKLKTQPNLVLKDGRPIPKEWDVSGVGAY